MDKIFKYIAVTAVLGAAVLSSSCRSEDFPERFGEKWQGNVPVTVTPYLVNDPDWQPTKAASDIPDIDTEDLKTGGFGVYAYYTGEHDFSSIHYTDPAYDSATGEKDYGIVFLNRHFYYDTAWKHEGNTEFWPSSASDKLSFFAYAPYDFWNDKIDTTGTVPTIKYDDYVAQNLSVSELEGQKDLLWGTNTSGLTHKNVGQNSYDPVGTVDMHFRHALAKVGFYVRGSLSGETRTFLSAGSTTTTNGSAGDPAPTTDDAVTNVEDPQISYNITYTPTSGWSRDENNQQYRLYTCTQTWTQRELFVQEQHRTKTESRTATYSTEGKRYLIENVSFKGFNKTGKLALDNASAYSPSWEDVTTFSGADPEYVLDDSNVLTQSLRYVSGSTVESNYSLYTGVTEDPTDLMGGYFLYAIPKNPDTAADRIKVNLKYHILNVQGTINGSESRTTDQIRTRTVERIHTKTRTATRRRYRYSYGGDTTIPSSDSDFTFTEPWNSISGSLGAWTNGSYSGWTDNLTGEWILSNPTLSGATVNYNDDNSPSLSGEIVTPFLGGRAYTINLILAGDKIELDVVPRPWELEETLFDYTSNINDVLQGLTYDSAYIDYADASGNVYINNRMGKFYFRLGTGKYIAWQASLVGDAAFGFTDENGNFLLDGNGNRVTSIRHGIDPAVTNYIYVKAVNSSSTVTSRAKLRIYYIDSNNEVTAALNLVTLQGVNEWTIVQNAN